jgi:two-component system response regulator AtoC
LKRRLLVVDDLPAVRDFFVEALRSDYDVLCAESGAEALNLISSEPVDMLVTDIAMLDMSAEELTQRVKERYPQLPVVAVTAYGNVDNAVKLMRLGAFDYIEKPFTIKRLKHTIGRAFEIASLRNENRALQMRLGEQDQVKALVGNSIPLQQVREKIKLVARTSATVLITGESGVGKELVAQEIHRLSDRSDQPLVKVDCASIPASLLESELFGREEGVSAGVIHSEPGKFELANHGVILLDEIGQAGQLIQAKLLRVIQDGEFDRMGGSKPVKVDVRIIATTSRDLKDEIGKGRFREDLYYRLNVVPLAVPPLRDRREDISLLIAHFIDVFSRKNGAGTVKLTEAAVQKLCNAYWKGNVRQLQNIIERAVILRRGMTLDSDDFQLENDREEQLSRLEHAFRCGTISEMEKLMILSRLKDNNDNRTRSAESLDISVRTLRNKLNEYSVPKKVRVPREEPSAI